MKINTTTLKMTILTLFLAITGLQPAMAGESDEYRIARGGRLYDNWFAENGKAAPTGPNPAYPATGEYRGKKASDWRCKECHGWDYLGKDGAYGTGKHFTGFTGIKNAANTSPASIKELLLSPSHGYDPSMLSDADIEDLSLFLGKGQVDMLQYVDQATNTAKGSAAKGMSHYQTLCSTCHGLDGKAMGKDAELGSLAKKNPWEVIHKIRHGQPKSTMPSLASLDMQVIVDILAYLQEKL